jgi:uncharacterized repeat protein (TIGR01451 family)
MQWTTRALATVLFPALLALSAALAAQTSADLSVTKVDDPDPVLDGGQITYTIAVANQGPDDAPGVEMTDLFPPGATFVSLDRPASWTCDNPTPESQSVTCTAAAMAQGTSQTFTLVLDTQTVGAAVSMTNSVSVGSEGSNDPAPENNSATATTSVQPWADLSVLITDDPDPVLAGAGLAYMIAVSNKGPDTPTSLSLSAPLPAGTTFVGLIAPSYWDCSTPAVGAGGTVSCTVLNPSSETLTLLVRVDPTLPSGTVLSGTATVSSDIFDPTTADHTASTTTTVSGVVSPSLISGTKTVSGDFAPGGSVTYTIVLHNSGPAAQQDNFGPELQDILGADLTPTAVSATSGAVQFSLPLNIVTWDGSIPADGSVGITIQATINPAAPRGTVLFNQALFFYDADGDGTNESNGGTDDPNVSGPANPTLFTVGQAPAPAGIPTLDEAGLALLALLLAMGGAVMLRRRRA